MLSFAASIVVLACVSSTLFDAESKGGLGKSKYATG
jgi:hypothetical protein